MVGRLRTALISQLLIAVVLTGCANAQVVDDPCPTAAFDDSLKRADYQLKRAQLFGSSAELRAAELALSEARLALSKRVEEEPYLARFSAETARMKALSSDAARAVLVQLGDACFDRLVKNPQAEVAAVSELAKALREVALFPEKAKQDAARIQRDFATTASTVQYLNAALARVRQQSKTAGK
ncbi:MAG TPA: hypothetical protein VI485_22670 [Vicinamibacterales bacterium]|nr:hypothetical protein [Vicinamibacterales bacterium]